MTLLPLRVTLLAASLSAIALVGQTTFGVIRARPVPQPQVIADLESRVLQNPEDIDTRLQLLQFYWDSAPAASIDPSRRSVRLQHILYLVERHPEVEASASKLAYVYRANGPYANAEDHEAVRDQWLAAVQSNPRNSAIAINAARFLEVEDPDDAEQVLVRALETDPENRKLAANLGFLYAVEILAPNLATHAREELELSSNPVVLAATGTALPNLAGHSGVVDQKIFDLGGELSARARQLAPNDPDIQGPMPSIKYFAPAEDTLRRAIPLPVSSPPSRIRVGENVQVSNLIRKTQPQPPADAQATGDVRFTAIIGRDGRIQNLQLISGHPRLVEAAIAAVKTWIYRPTLLNGAPVEVETTVTVSFPPN